MIEVRINGNEAPVRSEGLNRIADLIELIKSTIDPDHMITRLQIDGKDFDEQVWNANTNQYQTSIIEVETDSPDRYIEDRMGAAPDVIEFCLMTFTRSRECFEKGDSFEGNKVLGEAVETLQAFCQWYSSLMELLPESSRSEFSLDEQVVKVGEICKQICQQQLYQSWWALGETMKNELEPTLKQLEDRLRSFSV